MRAVRALTCLLVLIIGALFAQPAAAAMWLRISVDHAVAGAPASITVTTFVMYGQALCADDPQASIVPNGTWYSGSGSAPSEPSFRLIAYPAGRPSTAMVIPLTHRAVDSAYWDGSVSFPSSGPWTVRMAQPNWGTAESEAERCAGARIDVPVAPATAERLGWPWAGAAAAFVVLMGVLRARPRRAVGGAD
jgi:hypothetical protein